MFDRRQLVTQKPSSGGAMRLLDYLRRDVRISLRRLRRSPGFALMTVLTLALGIGANSAIFSLVEGVLLRPLPYPHADRLVVVWQTDALHRDSGAYFNAWQEFAAWRQHSRSFEELAALTWATGPRAMLSHGKPLDMLAIPASVDLFSMLGTNAALGRTFTESDLRNPCTLVLSYRFWELKLGSPRDIAGQSLTLGKQPCAIIGVMPREFSFYPPATDAWTLITPGSEFVQKPWDTMVGAFGLLKPGITRAAAEAELAAIQAQTLPEAPPDVKMMRQLNPVVLDLQSNFTWLAGRNLRKGLWMLLGASTLILLLASLNVGSLVLSRSFASAREMGICAAIGASRGRLIGQSMAESLLLGGLGTAAGLAAAAMLLKWFRAANPIELPPGAIIVLDTRVLAFTAVSGIAASLLFGLFPAWRATRADVHTVLKSGSLNATGAGGAQRATQWMVVIQVALSMILLAGAGLLSESLWKMASTNLGYRTDHLFTARIHLPQDRYAGPDAASRLAQALESRLGALPGVTSVGIGSDFVPRGLNSISISGRADSSTSDVATQDISPGGLRTLMVPLLRGRMFDGRDQNDSQPVVLMNEALAREYFPGADPLGKSIKLGRAEDASRPWLTVIGVVGNVKTTTVFQEMGYIEPPALYRPLAQSSPQSSANPSLALMVAVQGSPLALVSNIQQRLSTVDPNLVLSGIDDLRMGNAAALSQPRFRSLLLSGFAGLALVLALVGLYGVLSQIVTRRSREIGIRMALGAGRDRILRAVLGQACAMTIAGVAIGGALALMGFRVMRGMLYGIVVHGAGELGLAALALVAMTAAAASFPAYRAASIDPIRVLRDE
jgi:predicted permease